MLMTRFLLTILWTLTLFYSATGQDKYRQHYYKPSKPTVDTAQATAKSWLDKYAAKIGIPSDLQFDKLEYHPSEATFATLDDLFYANKKPKKADIQKALLDAETFDMYCYKEDFNNTITKLPQRIYFSVNAAGQFYSVDIYEADGVKRHIYNINGERHEYY
jgi:hypothetical protein